MPETLTDVVRVAVNVPETKAGMATKMEYELPSSSPVGDIIPELVGYIIGDLQAAGKDVEWLTDSAARFQLSKRVNLDPFEENKTLFDVGIRDGMEVYLSKRSPNERFSALQDDVSEGVAYYHNRHYPDWGVQDSQKFGVIALGVLAVFLSVLGALSGSGDSLARWPILGAAIAVAGTSLSVSVALYRIKSALRPLAATLMVSAYSAVACAAWVAIPRPPGLFHVALTAGVLAACAVIFSSLSSEPAALHHGVGVPALGVLVVMAINYFYHSSPSIIAAQVFIIEMMLLLVAFRLSMAFAHIETPYVPATGEPLLKQTGKNSFDVAEVSARSTSQVAIESILNQEDRVIAAHNIHNGITAGIGFTMSLAAAVMGYFTENHVWLTFALAIEGALLLMYRGRYSADRAISGILLVSAIVVWATYLVAIAVAPAREYLGQPIAVQMALGFVVLAAFIVMGTIWSLRERYIHSANISKMLEMLEWVVLSLPIPTLFFLMDGYSRIRHR